MKAKRSSRSPVEKSGIENNKKIKVLKSDSVRSSKNSLDEEGNDFKWQPKRVSKAADEEG